MSPSKKDNPVKLAMLNAPSLAEMAGVSVWTVRAYIAGQRGLLPETRAKIADAMRRHADNLRTLADRLESQR